MTEGQDWKVDEGFGTKAQDEVITVGVKEDPEGQAIGEENYQGHL